jgi:hypothetical protein
VKVGDLVRYKHDRESVGLITKVSPNIHNSVTYPVWAMMSARDVFDSEEQMIYNYQLEVVNEGR